MSSPQASMLILAILTSVCVAVQNANVKTAIARQESDAHTVSIDGAGALSAPNVKTAIARQESDAHTVSIEGVGALSALHARAKATRNTDSLDHTVQRKGQTSTTRHHGKLKQMKIDKCLAVPITLPVVKPGGGATLEEVDCTAEAPAKDLIWTQIDRASSWKQIGLEDLKLCLQAVPDAGSVFALPCLTATDADYKRQLWAYSHSTHEIKANKFVGAAGVGKFMCLASSDKGAVTVVETCDATKPSQKWQLQTETVTDTTRRRRSNPWR